MSKTVPIPSAPFDLVTMGRVGVEVRHRQLQVGRAGLPVEQQREVVGRVDLAERQRRAQRGVDADVAIVDTELAQCAPAVDAERVVTDLRDDGGARAQPCRGDRDVGRRPAERLGEGRDVLERDVDLLRIEVDADAPHRHEIHAGSSSTSVPWVPSTVWS